MSADGQRIEQPHATIPMTQGLPVSGLPSPRLPLTLFAVALAGIACWSLVEGGSALPPTFLVLPLMTLALVGAALLTARRQRIGWGIGLAVALLGCLAGTYSLVVMPGRLAEGEALALASMVRAAVAFASLCFLAGAGVVLLRRIRQKRNDGPLAPIGWR